MNGALRELFIAIGVDTDDLDAAGKKVGNLGERFKKLGRDISDAFGGPYVQVAIGFLIHKVAELGTAIRNQAAQIGVTTDELQKLQFASESAGMESDGLAQSITKLGRKASEAARNGGDQAKLFRRLGISLKDANGQVRPGVALYRDAADAIAGMSNPSDRAAAAMALFEEEGARMLPLLQRGSAGLDELGADFEALGGGLSGETLDSIAEFNAQWARLKLAMLGVVSKIGAVLFPAFSWLADMFSKLSAATSRMVGGTKILESAFVVLGVIAVRSLYRIIAAHAALLVEAAITWGPMILAIGLIILVLDDLWTAWTGGESVIGDTIDAIFGLGTTQAVIQAVKDQWTALVEAIPQLASSWNYVIDQIAAKWAAFVAGFKNAIPAPLRDLFSGAMSATVNAVTGGTAGGGGIAAAVGTAVASPTVRAPSSGGGNSNTVNSRNQVNITVQGTADGRTVDAISREVQRQLDQHARDMGDLTPRTA